MGSLRLRVEEIAATEAEAVQAAEVLRVLLGLLQGIELSPTKTPEDAVMRRLLDSLKVEQRKDRAVVVGTVPVELLRAVVAATPQAGSK